MSENGSLKPLLRLDQVLVDRGLMPSRSRAADAILRKTVLVNGEVARKASQKTAPDCLIEIDDPAEGYVSRGALKLKAALSAFRFDAFGRHAFDLGASTGGFTQVLLEAGAAHVFAIDVGREQIHPSLKKHKNLTVREGLNARDLNETHFTEAGLTPHIEALVCDVSFISLKLVLPPVFPFLTDDAWIVLLIKPQFEVGKEAIGKGGIVRDEETGLKAANNIASWLRNEQGWKVEPLIPCPIRGSDGNQEYLLGARIN